MSPVLNNKYRSFIYRAATSPGIKVNLRSLMIAGLILLTLGIRPSYSEKPAGPGEDPQHQKSPKQIEWPDTYAGRYAKEFFEAYNEEGKDALRRFIEEYHSETYLKENPVEDELAHHLQLRNLAGRLDIQSVRAEGDFSIEVIARSKLFGWAKFEIGLSPDSPHDPIKFTGGPTSPPGAESTGEYSDWKTLSDLIAQVRNDSKMPGLVAAVIQDGKVTEKAVTGVRRIDRSGNILMDDLFHMGSVTKVFTGIMIGMLVGGGEIQWEITIEEALPDVPIKDEYRKISLEQILQHRAGIPSLPSTGEFEEGFPDKPGRSPKEARTALVRQVLLEEPVNQGEYSYSNAGYVVAAYMVEQVTDRSWEELMRTQIFETLGLHSAGFGWPATEDRVNQPLGHYGSPPELEVQEIGEYMLGDMSYIRPAGDIHCSIEDLARFAAFLLLVLGGGSDILEAETVPRFWRAGETDGGERRFTFFGSGGTFLAMIALYPDSDIGIVAATNCGTSTMSILESMRDALHRRLKKVH
jgi:CubicO group peptidase (beta-lactamase class C family)